MENNQIIAKIRTDGGKNMTTTEKGKLIGLIITNLRFHATEHGKAFDEGGTFFALCFKSDTDLKKIAKAVGV